MKKLAALSLAVVGLLSCGNFAQEEKNKKLVLDYFKNTLVDGNMVVVHSHLKLDKTSRGLAVVRCL